LYQRAATSTKFDLEFIEKAAEIDEYFRQTLIVRRNFRMANRVGHLLASQPHKSFFFAFGAGHFIGKNDNVLNLLRKAGYSVEPVPSTAVDSNSGTRDRKKSSDFSEETNLSLNRLVGEFFFPEFRSAKFSNRQKFRRNRQRNRQFNDLWIRSDRLSTKPWNEIEVDVRTTPIPPAAVRYEKYFYFVESGSNSIWKKIGAEAKFRIFFSLFCFFSFFYI